MARPKLKELAYMLGIYSNKTIPQTYIGEFSNYELLLSLLSKVNEIIEQCNSYTEILNEIQKVLDDMDDAIKEEVQKVLEEMYESGEFDDVLADVLSKYYASATAPKFTEPYTNRMFRICQKAHEFTNVNLNTEDAHFSFCQGGCMFIREGITYFVGCFVVGAVDSESRYTDDCDIRIYRKYSEGWYFVKHAVKNVFHGNSICYDDVNDLFYIAPSKQWVNQVFTDMNTVFALDWNLDFVWGSGGISFSGLSKISNVCCYNGEVYLCSDGTHPSIYKVTSWEEHGIELEISIDLEDSRYTELSKTYGLFGSGLCCNDLYFFMGSTTPNCILRINRTTKSIDWVYSLGEFGGNHEFRYGEFENLSVIGNTIYFGTSIQNHNIVHFLDYHQVFAFDYVNNSMIPNKALTNQAGSEYIILNVGNPASDVSTDSNAFEISNPNGDANNYFPTLTEAIMYANAQVYYDKLEISIKTRNILEPIVISTDKNIFIEGNTYASAHSEDEDLNTKWVHIGAVFVNGGSVSFQNVQIENRLYSGGSISGDRLNYQVIVRDGNFAFRGGRIHITDRPKPYVIYGLDCIINWYSNIYINSSAGTGRLTDSNTSFTNCIVNSHGVIESSSKNSVIG